LAEWWPGRFCSGHGGRTAGPIFDRYGHEFFRTPGTEGIEIEEDVVQDFADMETNLSTVNSAVHLPTMEEDRDTFVFNTPVRTNLGLQDAVRVQENTNNAYSYSSKVNGSIVANLARQIETNNPDAVIYVGSGSHGTVWKGSFINDPSMVDRYFLKQDRHNISNQSFPSAVVRVLDLADPADNDAFNRAELGAASGQGNVFTIRAYCFSSLDCKY
jgi:hypothetical protein